jgi:hypothetical protein
MWGIFWFFNGLLAGIIGWIEWIILYIPNLIMYWWGVLMTMIFKPLDDVCIWWFNIWDGVADFILAIIAFPSVSPAFGLEMLLAIPIQAVEWIKVGAL